MRGDFPLDRAASPRWLTVPLSWLYEWSASRYHRQWHRKQQHRVSVPVISVGNLAVGGTGKSPMVIALAKFLAEQIPALKAQNAIAILSRGYGRQARGLVTVATDTDWRESGDEPLMIKRAVPHTAVIVEPERVQGAIYAVEKLGSKLILLDDGFQHRPLARDIDLVMIDGEHPLGNERMLPAGPLRERPDALARATILCTAGTELGSARQLAESFDKPLVKISANSSLPPELIQNPALPVFLISGIARPERLLKILNNINVNLVGSLAFGDHHPFGPDDREAIYKTAVATKAEVILTTAKDLARMDNWSYDLPLLPVDLTYSFHDSARLLSLLTPALAKI